MKILALLERSELTHSTYMLTSFHQPFQSGLIKSLIHTTIGCVSLRSFQIENQGYFTG